MAVSKVLIVDDVPLNLVLLGALVDRLEGLSATSFTDPLAALSWCERERPDLVLLDYAMPTMDGATFVRQLRGQAHGATVPVIVVTANTDRATLLEVLTAGANDFIRKPIDEIELAARACSLAKLGRASRTLYELATIDELTSLPNRRHFLARMTEEVARAIRYDTPLCFVMFDLDHFKSINDRDGHAAGDAVLREVGIRVGHVIRDVDFAGRLGGEEFGWLLPMTDAADAAHAADRLRRDIDGRAFDRGRHVSASFGVAALAPGDDLATLIRRADERLYEAKAAGRNRVMAAAA